MTGRVKYGLERGPEGSGLHFIACACGYRPEFNLRDLTLKFIQCYRCGAQYDRLGFVLRRSAWERPDWLDGAGDMVRARVWLLAHFGPVALKPDEWRYNADRDEWRYVGREFTLGGAKVRVTTETSVSFDKLLRAWRVPRADALQMIGYPEGSHADTR